MATVTLIDGEQASLWYHPESGIVHHKIHRFLESAMFRKLLSAGAECLEKNRATKWLSDDTNSVVIAPEDIEWGRRAWGSRVIKAGLKHWAIVSPDKAVATLQMKKLIREYADLGVEAALFPTVETALAWLESK